MAESQIQAPQRIDVHHHLMPPRYIAEATADRIFRDSPGDLRWPLQWTPEKSVEEMDRNGVAVSITSIATPGVWFGDNAAARRLARECNEYGAGMARDYPGRFGLFASLPLPDVDGSLREIEHALDVLKADGVVLMTSVDGRWPGDAAFASVFDELNRRGAVVFMHPTVPDCCRDLIPDVAASTIEFPMDTTRAIVSLLYGGTLSRCPDIRFIFSHAGGMLPFVADRVARLPMLEKKLAPRVPKGAMAELQKLYYDVASATSPMALCSLMHLVEASQVLFGTDFPFRRSAGVVEELDQYGFSAAELKAINRDNALGLFPRLKAPAAATA